MNYSLSKTSFYLATLSMNCSVITSRGKNCRHLLKDRSMMCTLHTNRLLNHGVIGNCKELNRNGNVCSSKEVVSGSKKCYKHTPTQCDWRNYHENGETDRCPYITDGLVYGNLTDFCQKHRMIS